MEYDPGKKRVWDWVVEGIEWQTKGFVLSLVDKRVVKVCFMAYFPRNNKKIPNMFPRRGNIWKVLCSAVDLIKQLKVFDFLIENGTY